MRKVIHHLVVATCMVLPSHVFAQTSTDPSANAPVTSAPAITGQDRALPVPSSTTGLNKSASDGVSTVTVPAVPCSTSARETDGTTTCVGIPGPLDRHRTVGTRR